MPPPTLNYEEPNNTRFLSHPALRSVASTVGAVGT